MGRSVEVKISAGGKITINTTPKLLQKIACETLNRLMKPERSNLRHRNSCGSKSELLHASRSIIILA